MDLDLKGKRVLVTGSSKGIGLSIAQGFLNEEAKVILSSRNQQDLDQLKREFSEKFDSENILPLSCDYTKLEYIVNLKNQIEDAWGGIDILIANVGNGRSIPEPIAPKEHFDRVFNLNFDTVVNTVREFYPLLKNVNGNIVFIASITGMEALGAPVDYSVAKTAEIAFAKNLARKAAHDGIRVNCVSPGNVYFQGGSWDEKMKSNPQGVQAMLKNSVPMKRFGIPEEIANVVLFLCSERASFMTGSTVRVDGGQTLGFF